MVGELKRNWSSHVTEEYFPSPQMAYVLSCFSKMRVVFFLSTIHSNPSFKKKVLAMPYVTTKHRGARNV